MAAPAKAGPGRPPGLPNKTTKALKDMILGALDAKGGQVWLEKQADANPVAFMSLIAKVLPTTLAGMGPDGEIKTTTRIELAPFSDDAKG